MLFRPLNPRSLEQNQFEEEEFAGAWKQTGAAVGHDPKGTAKTSVEGLFAARDVQVPFQQVYLLWLLNSLLSTLTSRTQLLSFI
nr:hypothetical protein CFP56_42646 [Quercus suber]